MAPVDCVRQLVVNADDFGRSAGINEAVIRAHQEGILTSASLMVGEPSAAEAVALARANPRLGVGLHLTLILGHSVLPPERIPGLVDAQRAFGHDPVALGWKYFFRRDLQQQLAMEINAQFAQYRDWGLPLGHVNGHLHLHMQPAILKFLMAHARELGIRHCRLTCEPLRPNLKAVPGRYFVRTLQATVFRCLGAWCRRQLQARNIRFTHQVFGQLQDGRVVENYLLHLLPHLPTGTSEVYSHPATDLFPDELAALVSPQVRAVVEREGIRLIQYRDL